MEATTLEQAAESLLTPSADENSDGDNLNEAVEAITEPNDDGQGDEIEATDEYDDDVEASDEGDDDQIDDEDLVEVEDAQPQTHAVKVDGNDEHWTLEQLKQSASGKAAISKRFQEVAEMRKQIEQHGAELQQREQHVLQMYQTAQGGVTAPTPPSRELFNSDPIGYMEEKLSYDEAKAGYDQQMYQVSQLQEQQSQAQGQARQSYLREQAEILKQHIPEIADPERGEQLKGDLMKLGMDYGFTADEMANVSDARYVRALNDARKYRALVAKRKVTQQKGDKARPVVRAGAKRTADSTTATRKKAQTRLQNSGSIDDALGMIFKS